LVLHKNDDDDDDEDEDDAMQQRVGGATHVRRGLTAAACACRAHHFLTLHWGSRWRAPTLIRQCGRRRTQEFVMQSVAADADPVCGANRRRARAAASQEVRRHRI
jgi:hypothetical protein